MISLFLHLPTWMLTRVLGFASFGLLFAGTATGIVHSMPIFTPSWKKRLNAVHAYCVGIAFALALLHAMILVIDTYAPFDWKELLVPFTARQHPVANGIGTLAVYGMLVILLTTDLRGRIGRSLWRLIHMTAYPVFVLTLVHGIFVGSDTQEPSARLFYYVTASVIIILTVIRISYGGTRSDENSTRGRRSEARHADSVQAEQGMPQHRLGARR